MIDKKITHVSEEKKKIVKELLNLIKNKRTILIASIKNIPASQFQEIVKKLRGKAIVKVPKKNLIFRALDSEANETLKKVQEKLGDSFAVLFSDLDSFTLAGELAKNKSPSKAKVGQEAPEDIEIPAGPTDLVPGPAISELGALGIQIQIEKGKITIKENKIIAKEGEKISQGAANLMSKLDIKPFSIGFIPICAADTQENKFYAEIKIDKEGTLENLKSSFGKALAFAVEINYITDDTIKFLIGKANTQANALEKLKLVEKVKTSDTSDTDSLNSSDLPNNGSSDTDSSKKDSENKTETQTPEENKTEEKSEGEENK